jgi:L-alanine-DL-glutamate epimerase-like enolase superfamily enzyme
MATPDLATTERRHSSSVDAPVERLDVTVCTVPTDQPEADGTLSWESTTMVLVEVRAEGEVGLGWTYGPGACATVVDELLRPLVLGRSAFDVPAVYLAMTDAVRNAGRPGVCAMAISAVDTALWDLEARVLGLSLHRLLGRVRDEVPIYGSGGFTSYDDRTTRRRLEGWLAVGIPRVKIKVGESRGSRPERDLARVDLARETIGPEAELYVDANGGYTVGQARRLAARFADAGVTWFEEPVSSDDLEGLRRVRAASSADITAGEYGYDLGYFHRMCAAGAVDCLQVDVTRCGGISEWRRVTAVAAAHQLEVSGHCAPYLHASVAAATPNLRHLEWFHDHVRIEQLLFENAPTPTSGALRPNDQPGHGLSVREDVRARYRTG